MAVRRKKQHVDLHSKASSDEYQNQCNVEYWYKAGILFNQIEYPSTSVEMLLSSSLIAVTRFLSFESRVWSNKLTLDKDIVILHIDGGCRNGMNLSLNDNINFSIMDLKSIHCDNNNNQKNVLLNIIKISNQNKNHLPCANKLNLDFEGILDWILKQKMQNKTLGIPVFVSLIALSYNNYVKNNQKAYWLESNQHLFHNDKPGKWKYHNSKSNKLQVFRHRGCSYGWKYYPNPAMFQCYGGQVVYMAINGGNMTPDIIKQLQPKHHQEINANPSKCFMWFHLSDIIRVIKSHHEHIKLQIGVIDNGEALFVKKDTIIILITLTAIDTMIEVTEYDDSYNSNMNDDDDELWFSQELQVHIIISYVFSFFRYITKKNKKKNVYSQLNQR